LRARTHDERTAVAADATPAPMSATSSSNGAARGKETAEAASAAAAARASAISSSRPAAAAAAAAPAAAAARGGCCGALAAAAAWALEEAALFALGLLLVRALVVPAAPLEALAQGARALAAAYLPLRGALALGANFVSGMVSDLNEEGLIADLSAVVLAALAYALWAHAEPGAAFFRAVKAALGAAPAAFAKAALRAAAAESTRVLYFAVAVAAAACAWEVLRNAARCACGRRAK